VRVLSIGGTGNISRAVTRLLTQRGVDLTLLNRGQSDTPDDVRSFPARGHALMIDNGWREIADAALTFLQRFA
jgi:uncharacterized protein YbjT (DUF2867 family)